MKFTSDITVEEIPGMQMGSDAMIARAAWVSTGKDGIRPQENKLKLDLMDHDGNLELRQDAYDRKVEGLLAYLIAHRHGSPFEHGAITLYVHAPIFVWREWHRHRIGFSYNEESARYKTLDPVFYIPHWDRPLFKVENWKAGRPKFTTMQETIDELYVSGLKRDDAAQVVTSRYNTLCDNLRDDYTRSYEHYLDNLSMEVDPGLARDGLNVGIFSSCWVTCNPRSIMNFLSLRVHSPQSKFVSYPLYEINLAADRLEEIFMKYWPETYAAFIANGRVAP